MYPTQLEETILRSFIKFHYLTADQVMIATGQGSLHLVQERIKHLIGMSYLLKIGRRTNENNAKEKYAYTYSDLTRVWFKEQGKIILPSRSPKPHILDHSLSVSDVLVRVKSLERVPGYKIMNLEDDRDLHVRRLNLPVIPDGFFEIGDYNKKASFPFLLENDMDEAEKPAWQEKVEKYYKVFGNEAKGRAPLSGGRKSQGV